MSKDTLQQKNEFQQAAEDSLKKIGQQALAQVEDMVLNEKQANDVVNAFNETVTGVEKLANKSVEDVSKKLNENLKYNIDKIGLDTGTKKQVLDIGEKVINGVSNIARDAIAQGASEAKTFAQDCVKQACGAIKSMFSNIGSFISGEKTKDQALEGIKGAWMEAGKEMLKSAGKTISSYVERIGGRKDQDKDKSHVEKVTEGRDNPVAVDKAR